MIPESSSVPTPARGPARGMVPLLLTLALAPALPTAALAQSVRSEAVRYVNPEDSLPIAGTLYLPEGAGPFPAVVLTTLAGVDPLLERLSGLGWVVLLPERRGIATIEQLLRASFQDLANDVRAAAAYLRTRPEVSPETVGVISQGGETMAALLAAVADPQPAFLILMATTGLPGDRTFQIEQHEIAVDRNFTPADLAALDTFVVRLTDLVVAEPSSGLRAFQVRALLGESDVALPRNAAFPPETDDQVRFFASLWWRELFLFQPDAALARLRVPTLVLMGIEDPLVPWADQLPAIERGLAAAPIADATVCLLPGRLQHSFSPESLSLIASWLGERRTPNGFVARSEDPPAACLDATPP